jgi:hypothetical protein
MRELRAAVRHRTLRTGIIEFETRTRNIMTVPCTIRDVSATGARLELNSSLWFPKQFTLIWGDGLRKASRVAWRRGRMSGVAFADGAASPDQLAAMMTEEEQARHRRQMGTRIRKARQAREFSEAQLADRIVASAEFVALAENGETTIPLYQLMRLADVLVVSLDWLVAGVTADEAKKMADEAKKTADARSSPLLTA